MSFLHPNLSSLKPRRVQMDMSILNREELFTTARSITVVHYTPDVDPTEVEIPPIVDKVSLLARNAISHIRTNEGTVATDAEANGLSNGGILTPDETREVGIALLQYSRDETNPDAAVATQVLMKEGLLPAEGEGIIQSLKQILRK